MPSMVSADRIRLASTPRSATRMLSKVILPQMALSVELALSDTSASAMSFKRSRRHNSKGR
jgi:hypothetical protein